MRSRIAELTDQIPEPISLIGPWQAIDTRTELRNELAASGQVLAQLDDAIGNVRAELAILAADRNAIIAKKAAERANSMLPDLAKAVHELVRRLEAFEVARAGTGVAGTPPLELAQALTKITGLWRTQRPELLD